MSVIKALSLWNPWAWLILALEKAIETRSWSTDYRGPLVVHATKVAPMGFYPSPIVRFSDAYERHGILHPEKELPMGAALCVAQLVDCVKTENIRRSLSRNERAFGNYVNKRWAWILEDIVPFAVPIPCAGAQKLWTWTGPLPSDVALPALPPAPLELQASLGLVLA